MKRFFLVLVLFFTSWSLVSCQPSDMNGVSRDFFAMDTFISLRAYGEGAEEALEKAFDRITEIEQLMSISIEESDVARINDNAGVRPVKVNNDTFYVIERALHFAELTNGNFDITIYPIARLWAIGTEKANIPDENIIREILPLVNHRYILLDKEDSTVFLSKKGMGIDLGGIAKGFAADEVSEIFENSNIKSAIINMGGSITTIGNRPNNTPWRIGIRNPRGESNSASHMAVLEITNSSVLSAGDYERYMVNVYKNTGKRYHHIFNPFTGFPAAEGVIAATIVSSSAIEADAISTALMVIGINDGISFLEKNRIDGILITHDRKVYSTNDLESRLEITDSAFTKNAE